MRIFLLLLLLLFVQTHVLVAQNANITLLDNWQDSSLISNTSGVRYSGCFTFLHNDFEYAVLGTTEGASFFQLTNHDELHFIDEVLGSYVSSQAITREYNRYQNYIYAIGDEGNASLQIIDVSYLPDSVQLVNQIQDERVGKAHTLRIDTSEALLYLCSVTPIVNSQEQGLIPLRVFSLENPTDPVLIWEGFDDLPEVHDMELRDEIAILNCGFDGLRVYDFSNPTAPIYLSNLEFYADQGYNHQGSLSPDKETYVFADETPGTHLKKCAVSEGYELQIQHTFGVTDAPYLKTPHNIYITNNLAYVAYYNDGLRIYDLRNNPPSEIAAYDTHTDLLGNTFSMWGAWGISANLPSKRILVSDRISGLFLFEFNQDLFEMNAPIEALLVFPNPVSSDGFVTVRLPSSVTPPFELKVFSTTGSIVYEALIENQSYLSFRPCFASGHYTLEIQHPNSFSGMIHRKKLVVN